MQPNTNVGPWAMALILVPFSTITCTSEFSSCADQRACSSPGRSDPDASTDARAPALVGSATGSGGRSPTEGPIGGGPAEAGGGGGGGAPGAGARPEGGARPGDAGPGDAAACPPGLAACGDDGGGGCRDLDVDPDHCGACQDPCSSNGVESRTCEAGLCKPTCAPGFVDCNGVGRDGCEAELATDPSHCGQCGHACSGTNAADVACASGACAATCEPTFGDCTTPAPGAPDDGCETDLSTASNCGACGRDCLGGACSAALACLPLTLATGQASIIELVADDANVYWIGGPVDGGYVRRRPLTGGAGAPIDMATNQSNVTSLAQDATHLYFTRALGGPSDGGLSKVAKSATSPTVIFDVATGIAPRALDHHDGTLVFGDVFRSIYSIPATAPVGTQPTRRNTDLVPIYAYDLRVDASGIYWADLGLESMGLLDTDSASMIGAGGADRLDIDDTYVYANATDGIVRLRKDGSGAAETIVAVDASDLVVDEGWLYYVTGGGLHRVAKEPDSTAEKLADAGGSRLYVTGTFVVYASGSSVLALAL